MHSLIENSFSKFVCIKTRAVIDIELLEGYLRLGLATSDDLVMLAIVY